MGERLGVMPGIFCTKLVQEDNTRVGASSIGEFKGSFSEAIAGQTNMRNLGASEITVESNGDGFWTVRGFFPMGFDGRVTSFPTPPSIHELEACVLQTNAYRSAKLRTLLSDEQIGIVAKAVTDYQAGLYSKTDTDSAVHVAVDAVKADVVASGVASIGGRSSAQQQGDAENLFRAVACYGVEDYIEFYSVYRRTLTAAAPSQVQASFTGVGKIWKTSEIQAFEGYLPTGWFQLPATSLWLKSRPQVIAVAGQKTQVIYSYTECATAIGMFYDAYNAATLLLPPTA